MDVTQALPFSDCRRGPLLPRPATSLYTYRAPWALKSGIELLPHQQQGVAWLQGCLSNKARRGSLLADDMGLGKTLQLLTFLASCIESGDFPDLSTERPPWRPILIVAPLILLENRNWEAEMERFFTREGEVFWPVLSLYGPILREYRRRDLRGAEAALGEPSLDLDRIQRHRVVITNYEALRDYEFSFAYQPNGRSLWSLVISDEAHEFKTPNSRVSHAIKKLRPTFHVACTGTPVENRLLDMWNLFDAVQPGLLGSARDFSLRYENHQEDPIASTAHLKERLLYQKPNAFLLRRNKADVLTLPKKHLHMLDVQMSQEEIAAHRALALNMTKGVKREKLDILHGFGRLSQHLMLLDGSGDDKSVAELKAASPKLRVVIEVLQRVRARGEKAIVFARHKDVQRMLARVFFAEWGKPVHILNGDTPRESGLRNAATKGRRAMLDDFRNFPGFHVLVLSPFVAGVGLTITEANHIVHYGRWWNPAVEVQATDRSYRIGQEREVHVYLPIQVDQTGQVTRTFDQLLDQRLQRKEQLSSSMLADAFLLPGEDEAKAQTELIRELS